MARAMWSGSIGFGLVNIPVKLYAATESKGFSFHLLHAKCKTRIKEIRWCPHCDKQVDWDDIERGFEYAKGKHVVISEEDLENLPLPQKNTVQVNAFCNAEEIDPIYFEKTYYFEPEKSAKRPFALLLAALEQKGMVGLGSVALRTKERLCAIRPAGGGILLTTLLHPDEIRIDLDARAPEVNIKKTELTMAEHLIDMLATKFDPQSYVDQYREALQKVIDAKLEGVPLEESEREPAARGGVIDLMDALKASLNKAGAGAKARKGNVPSAAAKGKAKSTSAAKTRRGSATKAKKTRRGRGAA
jgi:DNA end-binding protein Ku